MDPRSFDSQSIIVSSHPLSFPTCAVYNDRSLAEFSDDVTSAASAEIRSGENLVPELHFNVQFHDSMELTGQDPSGSKGGNIQN